MPTKVYDAEIGAMETTAVAAANVEIRVDVILCIRNNLMKLVIAETVQNTS